MSKEKNEYITPRKILKEEQPQTSRASYVEKAKSEIKKRQDQVLELEKKIELEIKEHNKKVKAELDEFLKENSYKRKMERSTSDDDTQTTVRNFLEKFKFAVKLAYYQTLNVVVRDLTPEPTCLPDIDEVSRNTIRPGGSVTLQGTCFGPSQGKVILEITGNGEIVELEVSEWSEGYIRAKLSNLIIGLRPYYGKIWVQTGAGNTSNVWPILFEPKYSQYTGIWMKELSDFQNYGIALPNVTLNDPDFNIVTINPPGELSGGGISMYRWPWAGGQLMAQGYYVLIFPVRSVLFTIGYSLKGPKGIPPPGPLDWIYEGDTY